MYNIAFTITGKPGRLGRESWGNSDDSGLAAKLYGQCQREAQEASRLAITCRSVNGKICSYYHYLVSKDVTEAVSDNDIAQNKKYGRGGSFFALSIRIDEAYCSNISAIYSLLKNIFDTEIIGNVLANKDTDGYFVYQIEKLSDAEEIFKKIEANICSAFSTSLSKYVHLFDNFNYLPTGNIHRTSIDHIDNDNLTRLLLANSEIYLFQEYNNIQVKKEIRVEESVGVTNSVSPENNEPNIINKDAECKKTDCNELDIRLQEKDTLIQMLRGQLSEAYAKISILQQPAQNNARINQYFRFKWVKIVGTVLCLIIVMLIINALVPNGCVNQGNEGEQEYMAANDTTTTKQEQPNQDPKEDPESIISDFEPFQITSITFPGNETKLERGKPYVLTAYAKDAKGTKIEAKGGGKFIVENALCYQDSMYCVVYIPYSSKETLVKVLYNYRFEGVDTIIKFPKDYRIKN